MRACVFSEFGPPEVLTVRDVDDPVPGPGDAVIQVMACGVNFHDTDLRGGRSRRSLPLPMIGGREIAGIVAAAATDRTGPSVGARVAVPYHLPCGTCRECSNTAFNRCSNAALFGVNRDGGYAEYVAAPAAELIDLPDDLDFDSAAACQIGMSTAHHALHARGRVLPGEGVVITGATGGVGSSCIQAAAAAGATPIALVSTPAKAQMALQLGAHVALTESEIENARARGLVPDVSLAIDTAGGPWIAMCMALLEPGGRIVSVGAHAGETPSVDLVDLYRRELTLVGSARATEETVRLVFQRVADGSYRLPPISKVPLDGIREVHHAMEKRTHLGKTVVTPSATASASNNRDEVVAVQ